ncbi:MAG: ABC transporter ATP-binding protein, partial [Clostridium sp.]
MIKVNKLSFSYDKKKEFIKDLTFNIEKGKITTILGPNGSGKSTVLSLLCGLNKISDGEIIINDKNINNMKYRDIAKEIATVHQQNTVPDDITVKELIAYG